jgi:arylsulfatase
MKNLRSGLTLLASSSAVVLLASCAAGGSGGSGGDAGLVMVDGKLGSAGGRASISGEQLPPPDPKFGGVIKDDALRSQYWWAPRVVPPKGAPNVLLIITDDAGFGVPSTFGGVIPTPTMDRIAKEGLRYNRVFSTALCSPTRAALITTRWASA